MRVMRSSIARWRFLATAVLLVLSACGGDGGTTGQAVSPAAGTAAASPTSSADPLEGEWRIEFTCDDSLRAISRLPEKKIAEQVGSLKDFMGVWGGEPTDHDPCRGATGNSAFVARFENGNLALCDAKTGGCEVHATYERIGDHSITVNDPTDNICPCPGTWQFEIADDQLMFHVEPNAWIVGLWEAAPWTRES